VTLILGDTDLGETDLDETDLDEKDRRERGQISHKTKTPQTQ
jgi:hypothetical protein